MSDSNVEDQDLYEEAYYHHTIEDIVNLMLTYGQLKVFEDITKRVKEREEAYRIASIC